MKRTLLPAVVFAAAFVVTYIALCYHPGLMIKLEAGPLAYFLESLGHMVLFKGAVSLAVSLIAGFVAAFARRRMNRGPVIGIIESGAHAKRRF